MGDCQICPSIVAALPEVKENIRAITLLLSSNEPHTITENIRAEAEAIVERITTNTRTEITEKIIMLLTWIAGVYVQTGAYDSIDDLLARAEKSLPAGDFTNLQSMIAECRRHIEETLQHQEEERKRAACAKAAESAKKKVARIIVPTMNPS